MSIKSVPTQDSCVRGTDSSEVEPICGSKPRALPVVGVQEEPEGAGPASAADKPRYQRLADVPDTLRTKESWKREGRRVRKGVGHRAEVKWPDSEFSYDKLYAIEDTQPVNVSEAERWRLMYWRLFVQDHNHNEPPQYI